MSLARAIRQFSDRSRRTDAFKADTWVQVVRFARSISSEETHRLVGAVHALHSLVDCAVEQMDEQKAASFMSSAKGYLSGFMEARRFAEQDCEKRVYLDMGGYFMARVSSEMLKKDNIMSRDGQPAEHFCHSVYVGEFARSLAAAMGYSPLEAGVFRLAGRFHDWGKLFDMPDRIFGKQGKLTPEEYEIAKRHALTGVLMLKKRGLGMLADLVATVHKRYDGGGYPEEIEVNQKDPRNGILPVCDVFDVVTRGRPYCPGEGMGYAFGELQRSAGTHLHPEVVSVALSTGCLEYCFMDMAHPPCLKYMKRVA